MKKDALIQPAGQILVVDDDGDIRDAICQILEYEGYNVLQVADGEEGLALLKKIDKNPVLILLDLMMPVMNGWEFKAALDTDPKLASIPVVVFSADGQIHQKTEKINVAGYLKKPIQLDVLLDTVKKFFT